MNRNSTSARETGSTKAYLATVGFVSILGQVVILRELNVAFFGIELIYILSIGIWLLGTAIGAAVGRRSRVPQEKNIQTLFLATAAVLTAEIAFIRGIRRIFGGVAGGYLPFSTQMIGLALALLPMSILSGLLFQWVAKRFSSEGQTLAKAYAIESAGGVLGGLSSTLLLSLGFQNFFAGLICTGSAMAIVLFSSWKAGLRLQRYLSVTGFICVLILFGLSHQIDRWMTSWNHSHLLESEDTPYSRVTITSQEEQVCVFEDDALSYETQSIAAEEFVQLSTLQSANPERLLLLGGGFEGIVFELLKLPVREIDYVEINKHMIEIVRNHLPPELDRSLSNGRVRILYDDPRHFLQHRHPYDMILVAMPEPMSAHNNRFYTKEFFEECSRLLDENGVLAFEIRSAENLWTPQMQTRNRSIYCALTSVFSNVVVIPGVTNIFMASKSALATDPVILVKRFDERNLQTRLVSPQYINYVYTNDRFAGVTKMLSAGTAVPNSDFRPACYSYTMSIWLSKFFPEFTMLSPPWFKIAELSSSVFVLLAAIIVLIVAVVKKLAAVRRFILVMLAGLIGMVLETLLMLNFQSKSGVLYQDIGVLLMSFMIGLSLGAFMIDRALAASGSREKRHSLLGVMLLIGFAALSAAIYPMIQFEFLDGLYSTSLILILVGAFVSAVFAFATFAKTDNRKDIRIRLYSADLIGGSIGSLVASLFLIPVYGILATSVMMTAVAVCALAFLR